MVTPAMHEWCKRLAAVPDPAALVPTAPRARRWPGRRMLEQLEAAGLVRREPIRCVHGRAQGEQWTIALTEDRKAIARRPALSETMIFVLDLVGRGYKPFAFCRGRSEHGGRQGTITALRKLGLLDQTGESVTPAGEEALRALFEIRD